MKAHRSRQRDRRLAHAAGLYRLGLSFRPKRDAVANEEADKLWRRCLKLVQEAVEHAIRCRLWNNQDRCTLRQFLRRKGFKV